MLLSVRDIENLNKILRIPRYSFVVVFVSTCFFLNIFNLVILTFAKLLEPEYPNRLSLATRYGFPTRITSLVLLIAIFISLLVLGSILKSLSKALKQERQVFTALRMIEPSVFLIFLFGLKYLLNRVHINGSYGGGILQFGLGIITDDYLRLIFILHIAIASIFLIVRVSKISHDNELSGKKELFVGWLLPISLILSEDLISYVDSFFNPVLIRATLESQVLSFCLSKVIVVTIFYFFFKVSSELKHSIFASSILFTLILIVFLSRTPIKLASWRPEFRQIEVSQAPFIAIGFLFASLCFIPILLKEKRKIFLFENLLGGLTFFFMAKSDSVVVPELDNLHLSGENFGTWYDIINGGLVPYVEYELHRGLLVNFFPSLIANFLSPGNPELYEYSYLIYSFLIGVAFVHVLKKWIPVSLALMLLFLLPRANGYVEIEYLNLIVLIYFVQKMFAYEPRFKFGLPLFLTMSSTLIILTPGQGIVTSLLMFLVLAIKSLSDSNINRIQSREFSWNYTLMLLVSLFVFSLCSKMIFAASGWIFQTNLSNSVMFGDNWLPKYLYGEEFPTNLRWAAILLVFTLLAHFLMRFQELNEVSRCLHIVIFVYLILISGRWFSRVDQDTLSRIGVGLLSLITIVVIPLFLREKIWRSLLLGFVTLALLLSSFGTTYFSFAKISNRFVVASQNQLNQAYVDRGKDYEEIISVINRHFSMDEEMVNLTGGTASNFYMKVRSAGGVQTPYMVVSDKQERNWINRIVSSKPNFLLGPYGSLGGIAADETTLFGRTPMLGDWLIRNTNPVKCGRSIFLIPIAKWQALVGDFYNDSNCIVPSNDQQKLDLWNEMNGSVNAYGNALINWARSQPTGNVKVLSDSSLRIEKSKNHQISFQVRCSQNVANAEILFSVLKGRDVVLRHQFQANLKSGSLGFDTRIFPIFGLSAKDVLVTLKSDYCSFA